MLVRLVLAEVLAATGDRPAAYATLASTHERVLAIAARIGDAELRRCVLTNVSENARTLRLAAEWLGRSAPE